MKKQVQSHFQIIVIDIMERFPRSTKGFKYLLLVADWLICPRWKATANSVVIFFEYQVFFVYEVLQFVVCDSVQCNFVGRNNKNIGQAIRRYKRI